MHRNIDSLIVKPLVKMNRSFSVIIPKVWVLGHDIRPGDLLNMQIKEDRIIISIPEGGDSNNPNAIKS